MVLWMAAFLSYHPTATTQVVANRNPFPAGAQVEVLSGGTWYAARVKEVRADGRWYIGYDGWSSSWDEEVSRERIRSRGTSTPVSPGTGGNNNGISTEQKSYPAGSQVEVKYGLSWYPAKVKEVRVNGRWLIGYDAWSSSWDEEVGSDRIRPKQASTPASAPVREEAWMAWPARTGSGGNPLEGAYLQVIVYTYPYSSYQFVSWFFTRNGRFSQQPQGGVSLAELSGKEKASKYEGTYTVQGEKLILNWADGRTPWVMTGYKSSQLLPIGAGATRQSAFPKGWRFDGSYEGGASAGGGSMSSSNTLNFRRDGTYTRGSVVNVSSTGRTTEVTGGVTGGATGTYQFDEYSLTLRENGTERKYTVFAYGARDGAGRPEQIFWEGLLVKRLDR